MAMPDVLQERMRDFHSIMDSCFRVESYVCLFTCAQCEKTHTHTHTSTLVYVTVNVFSYSWFIIDERIEGIRNNCIYSSHQSARSDTAGIGQGAQLQEGAELCVAEGGRLLH